MVPLPAIGDAAAERCGAVRGVGDCDRRTVMGHSEMDTWLACGGGCFGVVGDEFDHALPMLRGVVVAHPLDDLKSCAWDGVSGGAAGLDRDEAVSVAVHDQGGHAE